ncbi:MAG: folate-binding protein, partial [Candidatus Devosia euplotis]|nr:folate-binding protein [Candidatus Devosia euplotis]
TIAPGAAPADGVQDDHRSQTSRIGAGIPQQGPVFPANDAFAHDIGLDILNGIDFAKGCYVGQEVVSRMKHRGTARRRPVIVSGIDGPSGSPVMAGGREAGILGAVIDGSAVAILRLDRITDLSAVTVCDKVVTLKLPAWARYAFGESSGDE